MIFVFRYRNENWKILLQIKAKKISSLTDVVSSINVENTGQSMRRMKKLKGEIELKKKSLISIRKRQLTFLENMRKEFLQNLIYTGQREA